MKDKKPKLESAIDKKAEIVLMKALERIRQGKLVNIKQLMLDAGYSESASGNQDIKKTQAWQRALAKLKNKDYKLLNRLNKIAMGRIKGGGVREQIEASKQVLQLTDRFPDKKLRIGAFDDRDKVIDAPAPVKQIDKPDEDSQREEATS